MRPCKRLARFLAILDQVVELFLEHHFTSALIRITGFFCKRSTSKCLIALLLRQNIVFVLDYEVDVLLESIVKCFELWGQLVVYQKFLFQQLLNILVLSGICCRSVSIIVRGSAICYRPFVLNNFLSHAIVFIILDYLGLLSSFLRLLLFGFILFVGFL